MTYRLDALMQELDFVLDLELDDDARERLETACTLLRWKLDGKITEGNASVWGEAGLMANEKRFTSEEGTK